MATVMGVILISFVFASDKRDKDHQPERVMDVVGVKPGMIIGEVGAGSGYFTFKLAKRVEESGHVFANDISSSALRSLGEKCEKEGDSQY